MSAAVIMMALTLGASKQTYANPTGGQVKAGTAAIGAPNPKTVEVTQSSQKAIIEWQGFSIAADEATRFIQPSSSSVVLNRVIGGDPSRIFGSLKANGQVLLINGSGILFGPTARIDVAGLVASTADIRNDDFMAGRMKFDLPGRPGAAVVNQGDITVAANGLVALVAPGVENTGRIHAKLGRVALASGERFTVDLYGDGLVSFAVGDKVAAGPAFDADGRRLGTRVANRGEIFADGGTVILSAAAASAIVDNAINMDGVIQARTAGARGGVIVLEAGEGGVSVAGRLDATGAAGTSGGKITVTGSSVDLAATARLDASGDTGGGTILVGGGPQGVGLQYNSLTTTIAAGATLNANAVTSGDGGTIIAWANDHGSYAGQFSARGGSKGGDGGFIETSGKTVDFAPTFSVSASAANGAAGKWLIDPADITIDSTLAATLAGVLAAGTSTEVTTSNGSGGNGDLTLAASINAAATNGADLTLTGRHLFSTGGSTVNISGTGSSLILNVNAVNSNPNPTGTWIQDALNMIGTVSGGTTVNVGAGTYAESLAIGKALTLHGAGKGVTVIDPIDNNTDGILVSGNIGAGATVAITGLTVQGGKSGIKVADNTTLGTITLEGIVVRDNASNGFISNNGSSNPTTVTNINILNSVFAGNGVGGGSADINLFRFNGTALIQNVDILGTRTADVNTATDYGLQIRGHGEVDNNPLMTPAGNVTLDGVRIAGAYRRAHLGIQRYSDASNITMNNVVLGGALSANTGSGGPVSVASSKAGWSTFFSSDMHGVASLGNTQFAGGTSFGFGDIFIGDGTTGLRIDATQAGFSGVTRTHTAAGAENFAIEDRVFHGLDTSTGGIVIWQAGNLYVTPQSATQNGSIQRAINLANAGETVRVSAGTYAEQLSTTKSVALVGAGADSTIIAPTSLAPVTYIGFDGSNIDMRNILTIGGGPGNNTELSGFTIRGPVPEINAGIFVRDGAHAYIHDNKLIDIRESGPLSGNPRGQAIFVGRALLSTSGTAVIENNVITGYQKGGIVVDGPGSQATITGNTVTGEGPTAATAQNGIQVSRGASGSVTGNTVSGNHYTGIHESPDDVAAGILIFTPGANLAQGNITIGPNTVTSNEAGIWTNDPRTLTTISLAGVSGNARNAMASFVGGYTSDGVLLAYPAWAASNAALVNATAFTGTQPGDMLDASGALRVSGWSGFAAIQPAINAVATGGTVNVAAGTYAENILLARNLTLAGTDAAITSLGSTAGTSIGLSGNWTIGGPVNFAGIVALAGGVSLDTSAVNGAIAFQSAITGQGAGGQNLTLNAGSGTVTVQNIGTVGAPIGNLVVNAGNYAGAAGTAYVASLAINAGDVAVGNSTVHSAGGVTINSTNLSGSIIAEDVTVNATGNVNTNIVAENTANINGANVEGSVQGANVQVAAIETANTTVVATNTASVSGTNVQGSVQGANVQVAAIETANTTVVATNTASVSGANVQGSVQAPTATVTASQSVNINANIENLTLSAQSGSVTGHTGSVQVGAGSGLIAVNGETTASVDSGVTRNQSVLDPNAAGAGDYVVQASSPASFAFIASATDVFARDFSLGRVQGADGTADSGLSSFLGNFWDQFLGGLGKGK